MNNYFNYLEKYGNKSIKQMPISEVDMALLTQICYLNIPGLVPYGNSSVTLEQAYKYVVDNNITSTNRGLPILEALAKCDRFKNLKLSNNVFKMDEKNEEQFCAMTVDIGNNTKAVLFSGTDGTLTGWKENFNMLFKSPVPCQKSATKYLEKVALTNPLSKFIVAGHSKGGNLAFWSTSHCDPITQLRIKKAINFDGPGFVDDIVKKMPSQRITDKFISYIPQGSVIGRLFNHPEETVVMKSSANGLKQHAAKNWETDGAHFIVMPRTNKISDKVDEKLKKVVSDLSVEQREIFVNSLFDCLYKTEAKTLNELFQKKREILSNYKNMEPETKKLVGGVLGTLLKDKYFRKTIIQTMQKSKTNDNNQTEKDIEILESECVAN